MSQYNQIVFGKPCIGEAEIAEVAATLKSGWLGTGPKVSAFEKAFAKYRNSGGAVGLNSATSGLFLALKSLGVGPGDEVITTAMTFCATINAIIHTGARPVIIDITQSTGNMDMSHLEAKITSATKAIVPVHFAGRSCSMDLLMQIAEKNQLFVVEDCAHAIESTWKESSLGTIGHAGVFSFYATKNMTSGEGGMVISDDEALLKKIRKWSNHGLASDAMQKVTNPGLIQVVEGPGFKMNMMDLQAAIGIHQLQVIEDNYIKRLKIWQFYLEAFEGLPIELPAPLNSDSRHALHLFNILLPENTDRFDFVEFLQKRGVGIGIHYPSVASHSYYQEQFAWYPSDYPVALKYGRQTLSLPLSPCLTYDETKRVVQAVKAYFGG